MPLTQVEPYIVDSTANYTVNTLTANTVIVGNTTITNSRPGGLAASGFYLNVIFGA